MTQKEKINAYLNEYGSITPWEAMMELGIMRLAARISEMVRDGEPITKSTVSRKNKFGKTIRYAKYTKAV